MTPLDCLTNQLNKLTLKITKLLMRFLFPGDYSGLTKIYVSPWNNDAASCEPAGLPEKPVRVGVIEQ